MFAVALNMIFLAIMICFFLWAWRFLGEVQLSRLSKISNTSSSIGDFCLTLKIHKLCYKQVFNNPANALDIMTMLRHSNRTIALKMCCHPQTRTDSHQWDILCYIKIAYNINDFPALKWHGNTGFFFILVSVGHI